jgi:hypothetical protein
VGSGEEGVERHAEVEAFAAPPAAPISGLSLMGRDRGLVAGWSGWSRADTATVGIVELESVGSATGGQIAASMGVIHSRLRRRRGRTWIENRDPRRRWEQHRRREHRCSSGSRPLRAVRQS